jgi:hypothetical protein
MEGKMEIKKGTSFRVPVRLFNTADGTPKTGVTYSQVTVYLQKQGGSSTSKSMASGDWFEIDSTNFPGVYDLLLSTSDTNTEGYVKYSVAASGADSYIGLEEIVAALEIDSLKILKGRHKVDKTAKTFTIYDENGTTPLYVFDLKDSLGTPTGESVYERVPV